MPSAELQQVFDPLPQKDFIEFEKKYIDHPEDAGHKLNYAYGCVHCPEEHFVNTGLALLHELLCQASSDSEKLYLYYLSAVGQYRLGELQQAQEFIAKVNGIQPGHPQAKALSKFINTEKRKRLVRNAGYAGAGILAAVALTLAKSRK
ncbi:hypothetical protein RCL1_002606 [Eukaryota sp. TZLM3-RCL]